MPRTNQVVFSCSNNAQHSVAIQGTNAGVLPPKWTAIKFMDQTFDFCPKCIPSISEFLVAQLEAVPAKQLPGKKS